MWLIEDNVLVVFAVVVLILAICILASVTSGVVDQLQGAWQQ